MQKQLLLDYEEDITKDTYSDIRYGIKFANKNIGFNEKFYTFPYFLVFLLKRFLRDNQVATTAHIFPQTTQTNTQTSYGGASMNYDPKSHSEKSRKKTVNSMNAECDVTGIRQTSCYKENNKPLPDNNMFYEKRHNPLSSKGN